MLGEIWIYFILFFIVLLIRNCKRPSRYPPGPLFLPIIGSWYTLPPIGATKYIPGWRQKYGNIIGHKIGFKYMVIVTGVEEVIKGLKNPKFQNRINSEFFQSRTRQKKLGFFNTDGPQWAEVRRFSLRYLGNVFNDRLEEIMNKQMTNLFTRAPSGGVVLVNQKLLDFALNLSLEIFVSVKNENFDHEINILRDLTNESFQKGRMTGLELMYGWAGKFFHYDLHFKAAAYTHKFLKDRLDERRSIFDPENIRDYIDAFLLEQMKEKEFSETEYYSDEELLVCLGDIIQTSGESTSNTAAFLLLRVALNPHVQEKIHQELDSEFGSNKPTLGDRHRLRYCEAVIKEIYRMHTLVPLGVSHVVSEDTNFYGYTFPKGTAILFAHEDNAKNPELWIEPEKFRPERFINSGTSWKLTNFGLGKRSCIGQILVQNAMYLFVTHFFQKYSIQLPLGEDEPSLVPVQGFTDGCKPFKLILIDRQKS